MTETSAAEDRGTYYHASVDDFRRQLVEASLMWEKTMAPYRDEINLARAEGRSADDVPASVRDAYGASLMAYGYSYTLAAVIKLAGQEFGPEVAHALANTADDLLMNGDDIPGWNDDVTPEQDKAASDA